MNNVFNKAQILKSSEDCNKFSKSVSYETLVIGATTIGTGIKQTRRLFLSSADKPLSAVGTLTSLQRNSAKVFENLLKMPLVFKKVCKSERMGKFVAVSMLVALLSTSYVSESMAEIIASGDDCAANDGVSSCHWEIDNNGKLLITGYGAMKDYNSVRFMTNNPSFQSATTQASYGDYWDKITSIEIGEGITSTGARSFQGLSYVTSAYVPASLKQLGMSTFNRMNSLRNIYFPTESRLETVGPWAIEYTPSLKELDLPDSVKSFGEEAFDLSALEKLTIPSSLISIDSTTFSENNHESELKEIVISDILTSEQVSEWNSQIFQNTKISTITCIGDEDKCREALAKYIPTSKGGTCTSYCLTNATFAPATEKLCTGEKYFWNGTSCSRKEAYCDNNMYYTGSECIMRPEDSEDIVCDYEGTGYIKVGDSCYSPYVTYAKKRYTPAEANQWLKDNNNSVTITFKK